MKKKNLYAAKWLLPLCLILIISCQKEQYPKKETFKTSVANSFADKETKYNTFKGDEIEVGNGYARTFITQSHTGVPQELGIVFTDEALSGLPTTNAWRLARPYTIWGCSSFIASQDNRGQP